MRTAFSYVSILYAVGQVLDQIGVKSIAISEEEDGLFARITKPSHEERVRPR